MLLLWKVWEKFKFWIFEICLLMPLSAKLNGDWWSGWNSRFQYCGGNWQHFQRFFTFGGSLIFDLCGRLVLTLSFFVFVLSLLCILLDLCWFCLFFVQALSFTYLWRAYISGRPLVLVLVPIGRSPYLVFDIWLGEPFWWWCR